LIEKAKEPRKCLAVVRIRGTISGSREVRETLQMMRLTRNNYAVLVDDRASFQGMLKTARDYVTWGEVSKETVNQLIRGRGLLAGRKKITDEYSQKIGYKTIEELVDAVFSCNVEYSKLPSIQPMFRLHPPSKGFKGKIKKGYGSGGELGYRGEQINLLITRMI
jgi:large subunit ribosomal protein L30